MTATRSEPQRSAQDLIFDLAQDRIAGLRADARHVPAADPVRRTERPFVARFRDAVAAWLIGLGRAVASDDQLGGRAVRS
jgi:hypothetical protein